MMLAWSACAWGGRLHKENLGRVREDLSLGEDFLEFSSPYYRLRRRSRVRWTKGASLLLSRWGPLDAAREWQLKDLPDSRVCKYDFEYEKKCCEFFRTCSHFRYFIFLLLFLFLSPLDYWYWLFLFISHKIWYCQGFRSRSSCQECTVTFSFLSDRLSYKFLSGKVFIFKI